MSIERRVHSRAEVNWIARIGCRGKGVSPARIQDASIGGVYLITTLALEVGEAALVELEFGPDKRSSLVNSKIARKEELSGGKLFGYGIKFLRVDDALLAYLLETCS